MRLTGLFAAREGLLTQGVAINTIADNLANSNTPGFKAQRSEFGDLLASGGQSLFGSETNTGNGDLVQSQRVLHDKQGTIDFTDRPTDAAIQGDGFFNVSDGTDTFYTRAGDFSVDKDGNLVTNDGFKVLGIPSTPATDTTGTTPATGTGTTTGTTEVTPSALNVNSIAQTATPSTKASIGGNLSASSIPNTALPPTTSFQTIGSTADFSAPITVYDSLGESHDVTLYFYHTKNLGYTINAYVDSSETAPPGSTTAAGTPVPVGTGTLTFQPDGTQGTAATSSMTLNATFGNGSTASSVAVDLTGLTNFAGSSSLSKVQVDGNAAGNPVGYEIDKDGTFNAVLDSGGHAKVGQIVLSTFVSNDGLERTGKNNFRATDDAGDITTGAPAAAGRGDIQGGALENSTVDPASQFVDLIRYQRGYQANSQVITTISQLLSTTINMKS